MEAGRSCVPEVTALHPRSCALCPPARLLPGPHPGWVLRNPAPLCPRQASVTLTLQPPRPESHLHIFRLPGTWPCYPSLHLTHTGCVSWGTGRKYLVGEDGMAGWSPEKAAHRGLGWGFEIRGSSGCVQLRAEGQSSRPEL